MSSEIDEENRHKYKGVKREVSNGRAYYRVRFAHKGKLHIFGFYHTPKEAAKAHDLFVIKNRIERKTNFFKKVTQ